MRIFVRRCSIPRPTPPFLEPAAAGRLPQAEILALL